MAMIKAKRSKQQTGFSLIEVLVSLLVLAIGMLGMMSLQNISLQNNASAYYESQAMFLAYDALDRIRTSKNQGNYAITLASDAPTTVTDCKSATCTAAQLAQWDIKDWLENVEEYLPQGDAQISFSGTTAIIRIVYAVSRDATEAARDFELRSQI